MLITVIQTVIRIVGHRNSHVLHSDHGVHCPHGHHGHHVREQASAELEDRESLAVAAASVQDQDTEEGETFIERCDHHHDGLDNHFAIGGDHHDGLDNHFTIGGDHDDGLDDHFAINEDDHCRYSKGVSAVETILLVDRLRQQAFSHPNPFSLSFQSSSFIITTINKTSITIAGQQDRVNLTSIVRWQ